MANLIRLKQIESGSQLQVSAGVGADFSSSVFEIIDGAGLISSSAQVNVASASGFSQLATDLEVSVISSSISSSQALISSSISSSIAATLSGSAFSVTALSQSVSNTFATQSSNLTSVSSSLSAFTSSIGLTIKAKLNTENVITSSRQLDGSVINNLTLGTTGDAYSLIVSGALAVVDADITISGSQFNVGGQIWVNGQTGSAGNPPTEPYDNIGNAQSDIIDQGEW